MREQAIEAMVLAYLDGMGTVEDRMARALDALLAILPTEEMAEASAKETVGYRRWPDFSHVGRADLILDARRFLTAALATLADKGDDHDAG